MADSSWVDRTLYPFESKWFDVDHKTLHYIDEGSGEPVIFVHNFPTWSFMFRDMIRGLSPNFRCIAVDNLGFGLSDKPTATTYRPEKMAEYLNALIQHLQLENITFITCGIGTPIGLSYALDHPHNIRHIVVINGFMWSLKGNADAEKVSRMAQGVLGKWAYLKWNLPTKVILKMMIRDRSRFTKDVHRHYVLPFADKERRHAPRGYAQALIGSSPWFQSLWDRREDIKDIPSLLLWGMGDRTFGEHALSKWRDLWPEAKVMRFKNNGHFLAEEQGSALVPEVTLLLTDTNYLPTKTVDV
ncbi:MAG TPA: alpha/beta fold hydrolase [Fimbriimonadaceae bacterium]|nr:alpha/beta fold hydrolase [Fimbriimonadaceae bacterium]